MKLSSDESAKIRDIIPAVSFIFHYWKMLILSEIFKRFSALNDYVLISNIVAVVDFEHKIFELIVQFN